MQILCIAVGNGYLYYIDVFVLGNIIYVWQFYVCRSLQKALNEKVIGP